MNKRISTGLKHVNDPEALFEVGSFPFFFYYAIIFYSPRRYHTKFYRLLHFESSEQSITLTNCIHQTLTSEIL